MKAMHRYWLVQATDERRARPHYEFQFSLQSAAEKFATGLKEDGYTDVTCELIDHDVVVRRSVIRADH